MIVSNSIYVVIYIYIYIAIRFLQTFAKCPQNDKKERKRRETETRMKREQTIGARWVRWF